MFILYTFSSLARVLNPSISSGETRDKKSNCGGLSSTFLHVWGVRHSDIVRHMLVARQAMQYVLAFALHQSQAGLSKPTGDEHHLRGDTDNLHRENILQGRRVINDAGDCIQGCKGRHLRFSALLPFVAYKPQDSGCPK